MKTARTTVRLAFAALLALATGSASGAAGSPAPSPPAAAAPASESSRFVKNGLAIEFSMRRADGGAQPLVEGDQAKVTFRVTSESTGLPARALDPSAWIDLAGTSAGGAPAQPECKQRVATYMKGIVGMRPLVDLNSYYLLVLNKDPSISVIDPLVGMTGRTSLLTTVPLQRSPADWTASRDARLVFVSMPRAGAVAVVDAEAFKTRKTIEAGKDPTRVALQPDGRYVWIGNDAKAAAESGVTVVDTETLEKAATIRTGAGHHEIAFAGRHAFVTNRGDGTVSVIDAEKLQKVKDLRTGPVPISIASSSLSQAVYVADGKQGTVTVVSPSTLEIAGRIAAKPGLGPLRFSEDGRWGFVVNTSEHAVHVLDAAENRLVHTIAVAGQPYQVALTRAFAYVRLLDSERVAMINLQSVGEAKRPTVQYFGAGAAAPKLARDLSIADSIVPAAMDAAVFVVSPSESTTFFYMEGMNAPMGSFGGYGHETRAAMVVDRSLREVEPGVYSGQFRIPAPGTYEVALLVGSPGVVHCFSSEAGRNPAVRQGHGELAVEYVDLSPRATAGEELRVRFRLVDPDTREPRTGVHDARVLHYASPGTLRTEVPAREVEPGVYEAARVPETPGAYYLYVAAPSLKVKYGDLPYRTVIVERPRARPPAAAVERAAGPRTGGGT